MRSGVEVPELPGPEEGVSGARPLLDVLVDEGKDVPMVVLRVMFVVSADGGGGRC